MGGGNGSGEGAEGEVLGGVGRSGGVEKEVELARSGEGEMLDDAWEGMAVKLSNLKRSGGVEVLDGAWKCMADELLISKSSGSLV